MPELKNELVWSYSRHKLLEACPRAYWNNYYGSWGGWGRTASEEARELWQQKKLTSVPLWTGTVVHRVAETLLKRRYHGKTVTEQSAADFAYDTANQDITDSAERRGTPSKNARFQEHYYQMQVDWDAAVDEIERQVRGLFENSVFLRLIETPEKILEVEELRRFPVEDGEVYVSLDVLVDDGAQGAEIIDWKTGENHEDGEIAAQLGVYGLYVSGILGIDPLKIVARHVNLRYQTETLHPVGPSEIEAARSLIQQGLRTMRSLLSNPQNNTASSAKFPMLPEGSARCGHCVFRKSCNRIPG